MDTPMMIHLDIDNRRDGTSKHKQRSIEQTKRSFLRVRFLGSPRSGRTFARSSIGKCGKSSFSSGRRRWTVTHGRRQARRQIPLGLLLLNLHCAQERLANADAVGHLRSFDLAQRLGLDHAQLFTNIHLLDVEARVLAELTVAVLSLVADQLTKDIHTYARVQHCFGKCMRTSYNQIMIEGMNK